MDTYIYIRGLSNTHIRGIKDELKEAIYDDFCEKIRLIDYDYGFADIIVKREGITSEGGFIYSVRIPGVEHLGYIEEAYYEQDVNELINQLKQRQSLFARIADFLKERDRRKTIEEISAGQKERIKLMQEMNE